MSEQRDRTIPLAAPEEAKGGIPVYSGWEDVPKGLHTANQWLRERRKIRKDANPTALLRWTETGLKYHEEHHSDGTVTRYQTPGIVTKTANLYAEAQTREYHPALPSAASETFRRYFVNDSSKEFHIRWTGNRWSSLPGRLRDCDVKAHVAGRQVYGIRGGTWTWWGAIDLDLHGGDPAIFLAQFRVLLDEFHGKDKWHFQVADDKAGGVHLIQVLPNRIRLDSYRITLRDRLRHLDELHPDLAERARAAGMKTLGDLEIFPDPNRSFRLPLCAGRTLLLDKPLPVTVNRRKRPVPDVLGYVSWLAKGTEYMPKEQVIDYVAQRLVKQPAPTPRPAIQERLKKNKIAPAIEAPPAPQPRTPAIPSLGRMKGRYAETLVDFWTGKNTPPDSLNTAIRLLALMLPYYLPLPEDAVKLIEKYVDELPETSLLQTCRGRTAKFPK